MEFYDLYYIFIFIFMCCELHCKGGDPPQILKTKKKRVEKLIASRQQNKICVKLPVRNNNWFSFQLFQYQATSSPTLNASHGARRGYNMIYFLKIWNLKIRRKINFILGPPQSNWKFYVTLQFSREKSMTLP